VCLQKTPVLEAVAKARVFVSIYVEGTQDSEAQDRFSRLIFRKAENDVVIDLESWCMFAGGKNACGGCVFTVLLLEAWRQFKY
jgi:hypothetical protein